MKDSQEGRCQCGDISYSLKKNKIISAHHCHCKDCQRITGSGKATIIFIAKKYVDLKENQNILKAKARLDLTRRGFALFAGQDLKLC